ncbi:hypothetical protein, conserved in T. vivax [Trypanosoma vivax Y486]|uniref:Uncharacterized protein n=1 Tax=Trypanosoma vivax (strain Y486) TaxID=1055687 RepID=F9WPM2_TRYVY|nr:hypothetical protein, conserved in T. vivax [Trypanosoma vivax Y486]|eukprot:CCD19499.1 hypothetical protein, conserved in T. vivax [Trypanosoma vivax Y486]
MPGLGCSRPHLVLLGLPSHLPKVSPAPCRTANGLIDCIAVPTVRSPFDLDRSSARSCARAVLLNSWCTLVPARPSAAFCRRETGPPRVRARPTALHAVRACGPLKVCRGSSSHGTADLRRSGWPLPASVEACRARLFSVWRDSRPVRHRHPVGRTAFRVARSVRTAGRPAAVFVHAAGSVAAGSPAPNQRQEAGVARSRPSGSSTFRSRGDALDNQARRSGPSHLEVRRGGTNGGQSSQVLWRSFDAATMTPVATTEVMECEGARRTGRGTPR